MNIDKIIILGIPSGIHHKYYSIDLSKETILKDCEYNMFFYLDADSQTWQSDYCIFTIDGYDATNANSEVVFCCKKDENMEHLYYLYEKSTGNKIFDLSDYPLPVSFSPEFKYNDGYLFISLLNENDEKYWCLFDQHGGLILSIPYEYKSCCVALSKDGFLFKDETGNFFSYKMSGEKEKLDIVDATEFSEDLIWVQSADGTWQAIDILGNSVITLN